MWDLAMRGDDVRTESLFSYLSCEARVPQDHPLRPIRPIVDAGADGAVASLRRSSTRDIGRPSIPPEQLLRALLLQAFYSVRSERQLMEQLDYNLLFRWFVGLAMDDAGLGCDGVHQEPRPAAGGRDRAQFFQAVLDQPEVRALLSDEHFSVDGTLIEAWASMKSFVPKDEAAASRRRRGGRNAERDFHGEKRTQRHARLDHRSRRQAVPQGPRQGGQALLHGPRADGEPQRPDRRCPADAGHRHRRARGGRGHAGPPGRAGTGSRSAPTRATTRRASSPVCGR